MAPPRKSPRISLGRGKRSKNNLVCIVGLKNRPDLNGRYGTVIDHDKSTDRYTVKVSGKKNEEEESVLVKSGDVTNVDSKRAIQARKKGQFNTLEKLFAKKTVGQQQTEEEGAKAAKKTTKHIFVSPGVKVKEEEHRTEDDINDDDEVDKREHKKASSARQRNKVNTGNTFSPSSLHRFPREDDGTAVPGPSASWYLFQFQKREEEKEFETKK